MHLGFTPRPATLGEAQASQRDLIAGSGQLAAEARAGPGGVKIAGRPSPGRRDLLAQPLLLGEPPLDEVGDQSPSFVRQLDEVAIVVTPADHLQLFSNKSTAAPLERTPSTVLMEGRLEVNICSQSDS